MFLFRKDALIIGVSFIVALAVSLIADEKAYGAGIIMLAAGALVYQFTALRRSGLFLIRRSVARTEIFLSHTIFFAALSAAASCLYLGFTYLAAVVRILLIGGSFSGLRASALSGLAPDGDIIYVFMLLTFAIILAAGALGYLFGALAAWRRLLLLVIPVVFCVGAIFGESLWDFAFDGSSGLLSAAKFAGSAVVLFSASYPAARMMTTVRR